MKLNQQIGPAPDSSSHPHSDTCPLLDIELLDLGGQVVYPLLEPTLQVINEEQDWNIDHLDFKVELFNSFFSPSVYLRQLDL